MLLASIMPSASRVLNVAVMSDPIPEPLFPKLGSNGETEWAEHEFKEEQVEMAWRVVGIHDKARKPSDMKAKWEFQRKEKEQPYAEKAKEERLEVKKETEAERKAEAWRMNREVSAWGQSSGSIANDLPGDEKTGVGETAGGPCGAFKGQRQGMYRVWSISRADT